MRGFLLFTLLQLFLLTGCEEEKKPPEPVNDLGTQACTDCQTCVCEISDTGLALIRQYEGYMPKCYQDVAGYWTVGYGHLLQNKSQCPDKPLSIQQALYLLKQDVQEAEDAVQRYVTVPLTQGQYDALVSWTFNLGQGSLRQSTMLERLNAGDFATAAEEMKRWDKAGGQRVIGLRIRRNVEAFWFGNG